MQPLVSDRQIGNNQISQVYGIPINFAALIVLILTYHFLWARHCFKHFRYIKNNHKKYPHFIGKTMVQKS